MGEGGPRSQVEFFPEIGRQFPTVARPGGAAGRPPSCRRAATFSFNQAATFAGLAGCKTEADDHGWDMPRLRRYWTQTITFVNRCALWSDRHLPPGVRSLVGVLAMACGVLGFLPILGFWMFPLGVVLVALDIPIFRRRVLKWLARQSG